MLFLVISTPRADPPSTINSSRRKSFRWFEALIASRKILSHYARVGRGGVVVFDVETMVELHRYMNEWSEMVPVHFDVYPLLGADEAKAYLKVHGKPKRAAR